MCHDYLCFRIDKSGKGELYEKKDSSGGCLGSVGHGCEIHNHRPLERVHKVRPHGRPSGQRQPNGEHHRGTGYRSRSWCHFQGGIGFRGGAKVISEKEKTKRKNED